MTTPSATTDWLPGFERIEVAGKTGGTWADTTSPWRGVLHTVEGGWDAAISAYRSAGIPPHFTVDPKTRRRGQHVSLNRSSYAMENDSGGVETNRLHAVQVEIVGYAAQSYLMPDEDLEWLGVQVLRPLANATGIKPKTLAFYDGRAGFTLATETAPQRMSFEDWLTWDGWCGHQHVPENAHWDPGALNVARAIAYAFPAAPRPPAPVYDFLEDSVKATLVPVPLDANGNGWVPWDPGFGRPPVGPQATVNAAFPPAKGYLPIPDVGVQVRDNSVVVIAKGGTPGATIDVHVTAA